jgi:hypothetical protein
VKIRTVSYSNRRKGFEVVTKISSYWFPYARLMSPVPPGESVVHCDVDEELGREGFCYRLSSGDEGAVHLDAVLEYNRDPGHVRTMMLHKLTVVARERIDLAGLSRREVIRRLSTSPAQLYRLLDPTNYRKSVDQMVALLTVLDCEVELVVSSR